MTSVLETDLINAISVRKQNTWKEWLDRKKQYIKKTAKFRKDFPVSKISKFTIKDYVAGNQNKKSFCYRIERGLRAAGSISGSPVNRFGVYYSAKEGKLKATKYLNEDVEKGLETIKSEIITLIESANNLSFDQYDQSLVSNMFKNKILHVYNPDSYLSIYSPEHLVWICDELGLSYQKKHPFYTHMALLDFKRNHDEFANLSNWEFGHLIYKNCEPQNSVESYGDYIKQNNKGNGKSKDSQNIIWCDHAQIGVARKKGKRGTGGKGNYRQTHLQNMKTGEKGEAIVYAALSRRWQAEPGFEIEHVSKKDDSLGYDIELSLNGQKQFIEVKSTRYKLSNSRIFITQNELDAAEEHGDQYYIYFVEDVFGSEPRITPVKNPLLDPHPDYLITLQELKYQLSLTRH